MRPTHAILAVSSLVYVSAIATPVQEPPLAEQQFKNIQSFKGEKASDVIPAMQFMSASLGVDCDYCHVQDRSVDTKEQKTTARMMIAMERDINNKNFDGKTEVTCATCHAGHTHPVAVPPVMGIDVRTHRSQDVSQDQVFAAYAKAVGMDGAQPTPPLKMNGTSTQRGETDTVEAFYSGGKFAFTLQGPKGAQKQGFNGSVVWFTQLPGAEAPAGSTAPKVRMIPLVYAASFVKENTIFSGPGSLPKLTDVRGGIAKIGGADVQVLTGTISGDSTRISLYFDKTSGLLVRTTYFYPTVLGNIAEITDYSDYSKVMGVELPMTIAVHSSEGDSTLHYKSAELNPTIDPSVFEPPK